MRTIFCANYRTKEKMNYLFKLKSGSFIPQLKEIYLFHSYNRHSKFYCLGSFRKASKNSSNIMNINSLSM